MALLARSRRDVWGRQQQEKNAIKSSMETEDARVKASSVDRRKAALREVGTPDGAMLGEELKREVKPEKSGILRRLVAA